MFDLVIQNLREVKSALEALALPPAWQRRLVSRLGRMLIAQAQKNIREQKTIDGSAMAARKRMPPSERPVYHRGGAVTMKKTHAEMLYDLVKSKWLGMKMLSDAEGLVHFFRGAGYVAYKHQTGGSEGYKSPDIGSLFNASETDPKNAAYRQMCTKEQANALIRCGYHQPREWILENITAGHALNILRTMKKTWKVNVPARPFLGVGPGQMAEFRDFVLASLNEKFRAKNFQGYR